MSDETYKLTYFDGRGSGEVIRLLFAAGGAKYEDVRIKKDQWPSIKPTTPFGQVPVLEINGSPLPQSNAIGRYLARKFGLAGDTPLDEAQVDAYVYQVSDFHAPWNTFFRATFFGGQTTPEQLEGLKKAALEKTPANLAIFEKRLTEHDFLVGDKLTWADLHLMDKVEFMWKALEASGDIFDNSPKIQAHYQRVRDQPRVKKWISSRPQSKF